MSSVYQEFLDRAIKEGVAPGLQAVVFDKKSVIFNGVSGNAAVADDSSGAVAMQKDTAFNVFSCSKVIISIIVLQILEKGLSKTPFQLSDLGNHEKLVSVLPEFKLGGGNMVTKILEGFGPLGKDGKKELKIRDAKKGCTLEHLLTHTCGLVYPFIASKQSELFKPTEGEPHFYFPSKLPGDIEGFSTPLVSEPGLEYHYGVSVNWLTVFAVRATGKPLLTLCRELIFKPLGIKDNAIDFVPLKKNAAIHLRDGKQGFIKKPFGPPPVGKPKDQSSVLDRVRSAFQKGKATDKGEEEGKKVVRSGPFICSMQSFSKILQAVLNHDSRLLSKETWELAVKDQTTSKGIKMEIPLWKAAIPQLTHDVDQYSAQQKPGDFGVNLLQAHVFNSPTISGLTKGTQVWAGLSNIFWFVDSDTGVGAVIGTQVLPFMDPQLVQLRDEWEKLIYSQIKAA